MDPIMPLLSALNMDENDAFIGAHGRTLLDHFLDGTCGVNLHGVKVLKAVDLGGVLGELLAKGIRQVVCRIC
jgi:hypothetical protein